MKDTLETEDKKIDKVGEVKEKIKLDKGEAKRVMIEYLKTMKFNIIASLAIALIFARSSIGLFLAVLIVAFTGLGIGDIVKNIVKPDRIYYSGAMDGLKTKFYWAYGIKLISIIVYSFALSIISDMYSEVIAIVILIIVAIISSFWSYNITKTNINKVDSSEKMEF